jgi:hypothetical protein
MHGVAPQCAVKEARPSLGGEAAVAPSVSSLANPTRRRFSSSGSLAIQPPPLQKKEADAAPSAVNGKLLRKKIRTICRDIHSELRLRTNILQKFCVVHRSWQKVGPDDS